MRTFSILTLLAASLLPVADATEPATETTAGWVKHPKNPALGGALGICFDISVLREGDTYRSGLGLIYLVGLEMVQRVGTEYELHGTTVHVPSASKLVSLQEPKYTHLKSASLHPRLKSRRPSPSAGPGTA